MTHEFTKTRIAIAVTAALSATIATTAPVANADTRGTYVTGDFHNHTTCSDGSISMQKLVAKSTHGEDAPWGLDWFVQAGHGGSGNRNCTLAEDESLATPAYPLVFASDGTTLLGPSTTWQRSNPAVQPKGTVSGTPPNQNMWRWQAVAERRGRDRHRPLSPQEIVDGLRSGNSWTDSGQLVDRLAFVACADTRIPDRAGNAIMEAAALVAAVLNTDVDLGRCAGMGEKLVVRPGEEVVVAVVARDPSGTSHAPYTFANPSLVQIGVQQPINKPVLDHIDVVRGLVTGFRDPANPAAYAGEWPRDWVNNPNMANVPAAAKNTSTSVLKTFSAATWSAPRGAAGEFKRIVFRIPNVRDSQYLRLRGTNLPASVPFETDANGNPLSDRWTNAASISGSGPSGSEPVPENGALRIPCTTVGTTDFDGCPAHMGARDGVKYSSYDVASWSDLWFYSNPIYIEVQGGTVVAGVQ